MGLSIYEFWDLTPREFWNKLNGWTRKKKEESETAAYYQRLLTTWLININLKQSDRLQPKDLFLFDFEESKPVLKLTKEEIKARLEKWEKPVKNSRPITLKDIK